jgi:hypothetical protein
MDDPKRDEQYSAEEIERRVKAAVQGAFSTSPKPLKSMTPKRPRTQEKQPTKPAK